MKIPSVMFLASMLLSVPTPAATYWVAPPPVGNNLNAGSQVAPFATITHAMTRAVLPGDVVQVGSGIYRGERIEFKASGIPGNPITLQAAPGASPIVRGSEVVANWVPSDPDGLGRAIYRAPWTRYFGAWDARFTSNPQGDISELHAGNMARNQFFVDGAYLPEVPRIIDLRPGSFYIDNANDFVYLWLADGSSPEGKLVEGTATENALIATRAQDSLVIRGITVEHCANTGSLNAMIRADATGSPSNNWTNDLIIENVIARFAAGTAIGLWACNPATVRDCILTDNGQSGLLTAGCKNTLVSGGQWLRNNTLAPKHYNHGVEAVHKVASCEDTVIENIESAYNRGFGMWVDGPKNRRITLRNNRIHHNSVPGAVTSGVRIEIAYLVDFYNNTVYRNDSGVSVDTSIGCRIFNNTIAYNTSEGIYCAGVRTQWDHIRVDAVMRNYGNQVYNNILAFNQQGNNKRGYIMSYNVPDPLFNPPEFANSNGVVPFAQNSSDSNLFFKRPGGSADFFTRHTDAPWENRNYTSLTAWQSATSGQTWDVNSLWGQDPLFVNAAADDFRLMPGSPAVGRGEIRSNTPAAALLDAEGIPRSPGDVDLGAYQLVTEVAHVVQADSYVENGGNAGVNYGSLGRLNAELKAGTIRKAYLRFELNGSVRPISDAALEWFTNASSTGTFQVYGLINGSADDQAAGWAENTITWNNAPGNTSGNVPGTGAQLLGSFSVPGGTTPGTLIKFASSQLDAFLNADTNNLVTLIIIRTTNNTSFNNTFHAKENTAGFDAPSLVTR